MLKYRILIVDDNRDIHKDFMKILKPKVVEEDAHLKKMEDLLFGDLPEQEGTSSLQHPEYQFDSAYQGHEALDLVEAAAKANDPYSLVLMDVRMPPGWDGIETTKKIWINHPDTEIILCTAYSDYSSEDIIKTLGISDRLLLLKKPFDPIAVRQIVLATVTKWSLHREIKKHTQELEQTIEKRTQELKISVEKLTWANQELDTSLNRLKETQALLLQASKLTALGEMAGGIAHEINNPLAIIQSQAGLLQELVSEEPIKKEDVIASAKDIENTTQRIAKIVQGLQFLSRESSGDPLIETPVRAIIEDTLSICTEKFKNYAVELKVGPILTDIAIECRAGQIAQVLLNLVNNSFDAICSTAAEKWIRVEVKDLKDRIEISVTDSGSGLPKQVIEKLFQPFFTTKEIGKGTGIGLSISLGIVRSHQGDLTYDDQSKNTRFVISLLKKIPR